MSRYGLQIGKDELLTKGLKMRTYAEALEYYNNRYNPPRSKKWKSMPDNGRPLSNTSYFHYGIHKRDDGAVYFRLYDTHVATYYPTDAEGYDRVEMNYYNSITTNTFIYKYGLSYGTLKTTEGKDVSIPYVPQYYAKKQGMDCSAVLYFKNGLLDVSKSKHADIYTYKSTKEDKDKRKEYKKKLDTLVTLVTLRLPEYRANAVFERSLGEPFGTAWRNIPQGVEDFAKAVAEHGDDAIENPKYVESFLQLGQDVFNILANNRIYNYVPEGERWVGSLYNTWQITPEIKAEQERTMRNIAENVTVEDFRKSFVNRILNMTNKKVGSEKAPWGQFRESIPRSFMWY